MRVGRRERDALFETFVRQHGGRLFRTALLLSGDWQLSEDLVQSTLARLYSNGSWHRVEFPEAYARRALVNAYASMRRKRMATELVVEEVGEPLTHQGNGCSAGAVDDAAQRIDLFSALAKLSPFDRMVVVLRYWDDLSVNDVAAVLGCSTGAVRNRSMRALHRLRLHLSEPDSLSRRTATHQSGERR